MLNPYGPCAQRCRLSLLRPLHHTPFGERVGMGIGGCRPLLAIGGQGRLESATNRWRTYHSAHPFLFTTMGLRGRALFTRRSIWRYSKSWPVVSYGVTRPLPVPAMSQSTRSDVGKDKQIRRRFSSLLSPAASLYLFSGVQ